MRLTPEEVADLQRDGGSVPNYRPPVVVKPAPVKNEELDMLKVIAGRLDQLVKKPDPMTAPPVMAAPASPVVIPAPNVVVNSPAPKQYTKWRFEVTATAGGLTKEIIATAIE